MRFRQEGSHTAGPAKVRGERSCSLVVGAEGRANDTYTTTPSKPGRLHGSFSGISSIELTLQPNLRGAQSDGGINRNLDAPQAEVRAINLAEPLSALISVRSNARGGHAWSLWRGANGSPTRNSSRSARISESSIRRGRTPMVSRSTRSYPELNVISNVVENGKPIGNLGDGEAVWHADMTYVEVPPKAAMLHSLEVPPTGGNTYFANMFAAYETLPADLKKAAEGKIAVHDASTNSAGMLRKGYKKVTDVREVVGAHHPLVRTDPKTGRKALFLGRGRTAT